jgi:hypothetical protein
MNTLLDNVSMTGRPLLLLEGYLNSIRLLVRHDCARWAKWCRFTLVTLVTGCRKGYSTATSRLGTDSHVLGLLQDTDAGELQGRSLVPAIPISYRTVVRKKH